MAILFDRAFTVAALVAEASNQSDLCMEMICDAIRNRARSGRFKPTAAGVVMQRMQFSEMNDDPIDNANLERVLAMDDYDSAVQRAIRAFDRVMGHPEYQPAKGATHFYADPVHPSWADAPGAHEVAREGVVHFLAGVK